MIVDQLVYFVEEEETVRSEPKEKKKNSGGDGVSDRACPPKKAYSRMWNVSDFKPDNHQCRVILCKQCFSIVAALQCNMTSLQYATTSIVTIKSNTTQSICD